MLYKRIRYFLAVANCLSFTEAAKMMYTTQQSMTWHISKLEEELGVKLFERTTRSIHLTEAGIMVRDNFIKINQEIDMTKERMQLLSKHQDTSISIGFYRTLSVTDIVNPLLIHLTSQFPAVQFDISVSDLVTLRNQLLDGKLDVIIVTSYDYDSWPGVQVHALKTYSSHIVLAASHPLAVSDQLDISDLRDVTMYTMPLDNIHQQEPDWYHQIPHARIVTVPDIDNLLGNVLVGNGFACLPSTRTKIGTAGFKFYPYPAANADVTMIVAYRKKYENSLIPTICPVIYSFYQHRL